MLATGPNLTHRRRLHATGSCLFWKRSLHETLEKWDNCDTTARRPAPRTRRQLATDEDVAKLVSRGASVFVVEEDLAERGIDASELVQGLKPISRASIAALVEDYDAVWHW